MQSGYCLARIRSIQSGAYLQHENFFKKIVDIPAKIDYTKQAL